MDKTLDIFFKEPTRSHYLMDISRKTKVAHTSIKNNLDILKKEGIIKHTIDKRGKRVFPYYKANLNNTKFKELKMISNINNLIASNLINDIDDKLSPKAICLFGSYRRGEDIEDSDIDLYIQCDEEVINLNKFEKILKRKIQLHFKKVFNEYPAELKNNIINGIIMKGFLEAF